MYWFSLSFTMFQKYCAMRLTDDDDDDDDADDAAADEFQCNEDVAAVGLIDDDNDGDAVDDDDADDDGIQVHICCNTATSV
jgi:hypothetical protein